jgi:hypothetical protein
VTSRPGWSERARPARLVAATVMAVSLSGWLGTTTSNANTLDRISLPFSCHLDQGRLRLEPSPDQVYPITGAREQRPFTMCPERQQCQTLTVQRFTVPCRGQQVPWADIAAALIDKGLADKATLRNHARFVVIDGRLGISTAPRTAARQEQPAQPANPGLSGWCSDQFGGPVQPFLRQACREARRLVSNLGGPPLAAPQPRLSEPAKPQVIVFPRGFAPVRQVGARLLGPLASPAAPPVAAANVPSAVTAAAVPKTATTDTQVTTTFDIAAVTTSTPPLTTPEPNNRLLGTTAGLTPPTATKTSTSTWITSVHLASAAIASSGQASSSQAAAERRSSDTTTTFMTIFATVLVAVGSAAAAFVLRTRLRAGNATTAPATHDTHLLRLSALDQTTLTTSEFSASPPERATSLVQLGRHLDQPLSAIRQRYDVMWARYRQSPPTKMPVRPPLTAAEQIRLEALPLGARLIVSTRNDIIDRIDRLRQTIEPLARTAPALHMALARDLMAGERRVAKITIASLVSDAALHAPHKQAQSRLQRVGADLDRLKEIIAGATASFAPVGTSKARRQLPRDLPEAYAALGVNPGVGDSTLKKLVDALRVSWHPDLATSADDRAVRDERIKEINVAWDLIVGRRAPE